LIDTLRQLCGETTVILLGYKKRYAREEEFFTNILQYFVMVEEPKSAIHPDFRSADVSIYRLYKK